MFDLEALRSAGYRKRFCGPNGSVVLFCSRIRGGGRAGGKAEALPFARATSSPEYRARSGFAFFPADSRGKETLLAVYSGRSLSGSSAITA